MDLSVTDLIVKTDRPSGQRGHGRATALASAPSMSTSMSTSIPTSAFNDLLARIDSRAQAPATERPDTRRPDTDNRASRDDRGASADRDDRASRNNRPSGETGAAREPIEGHTRGNQEHDGDTVTEKNSAAVVSGNAGVKENVPAPAPKDTTLAAPEKAAADGLTLPAAAAKNPVFDADGNATAASPAAAASRTKTADGGANATAEGKAAPAQAATGQKTQARPAQLADFTAPTQKTAETAQDEKLAALAKSALADEKGNTGNTGKGTETKAAEAAVQTLRDSKPGRPAEQAGPHVKTEPGALRATVSGQDIAPEPAPLRGPVVNGVITAQEVSAQGAKTAQANTGNGQNTAAQQAPQTGANPAAPRADMMNAAANAMTAPAMNAAENSQTAFRAAGAANQALSTTGATPGTMPGAMPGMTGYAGTQAAQGTTQPQAAARAQASAPVPVEDVAVHIARAAAGGNDQISIRLKPASLGHVEVKMEVNHDGKVSAVITADRADTLDMLARDAKSLERALADAGLKTDSGNLQFNLRGEGQSGNAFGARDDGAAPGPARHTPAAEAAEPHLPDGGAYTNLRAASGGLDIRV